MITARELFQSDEMSLPKTGPENGSQFPTFLSAMYDTYLKKVADLNDADKIGSLIKAQLGDIKIVAQKCVECVDQYLRGFSGKSYTVVQQLLEIPEIRKSINSLISPKDVKDALASLYRLREVKGSFTITPEQIFHIPFQMRHKVETQRYSIAGVPSLYCGGSLLVCWEELKRPSFEHLFFSRICAINDTRVLDFGYQPQFLSKFCIDGTQLKDLIVAYATFWPLIAACSIKPGQTGPFTVEYIVPNMLMQWIAGEDICDGIRYFSNRMPRQYYSAEKPSFICNFAFPAKTSKIDGFCDVLRKKFKISDPLNWRISQTTDLTGTPSGNGTQKIVVNNSTEKPYANSEFWIMESYANSIPLVTL